MLGAKPSSRAAAATLSLVSERSLPWPFRALDAVPIETPASAATSRIVTRLDSGPRCGEPPCGKPPCGEPLGGEPLGGKRLLHHLLQPRGRESVIKTRLYRLDALYHEPYVAKGKHFLTPKPPITATSRPERLASEGGAAQVSTAGEGHTALGPVRPTAAAAVAHRPLDRGPLDHGPLDGAGVSLTGGMLHAWQQRNLEVSLPLALRQLETAGNLANLRLAISGTTEGYRGPQFMDSDLYKTLEAIGWQLARTAAPDLADSAGEATALLEKAQQADGYLNSSMQVTGAPRYARLASSHELYCAGHLIQAAVACHRGPGLTGLLGVARSFVDPLVEDFMGTQPGLDGHPIVETALVELYREPGHEPYLRLASQFIEQRGHGLRSEEHTSELQSPTYLV